MPSFDIVSEVNKQEVDNALNQARKELATRFDMKDAKTDIMHEKDKIVLMADDAAHLKSLREIVVGKRVGDTRVVAQPTLDLLRAAEQFHDRCMLIVREAELTVNRLHAARLTGSVQTEME